MAKQHFVFSGLDTSETKNFILASQAIADSTTDIPVVMEHYCNLEAKYVANGAFSRVYQIEIEEEQHVLKTNSSAWDPSEDGQQHWLKFAAGKQNLPWVPQIEFFMLDSKVGIFTAVTEKLFAYEDILEIDMTKVSHAHPNRHEICCRYRAELDSVLRELKGMESISDQGRPNPGSVVCTALNNFRHQLPQAKKALNMVKKSCGGSFDLHGENVMFRKTKAGFQLVITDPLTM